MTLMRTHAEQYLAMRRSLGYRLHGQGRLLLAFADQMDGAGQTRLTAIAALAWATQTPDTLPVTRRMRLSVVRCFARHLKTLDPSCEVPPPGLLAATARRPVPYLYSPQEISALVHAAETLTKPLAAATYQALVSLLAVTGLRIAEALTLQRTDVDLRTGVLQVTGKYGKVRLVPLHASTIGMLASYAAERDRLCPIPEGASFFITCAGRPVPDALARRTFWKLLDRAGIHTPPGRRRPRMHDLRQLCCQHLPEVVSRWGRRSGKRTGPVHLPGTPVPVGHLLVPDRRARIARSGRSAAAPLDGGAMTSFAPILEGFFTDYLMTQRQASPHTIASYRDTFTLLLAHLHTKTGKLPSQLDFDDLDAPAITGFLTHLQSGRDNSTSTRNARLTAIHSLFRYAALRVPEHATLITRVLAMPSKRTDTTLVCFLSRTELHALLAAPDRATWHGRRDYTLILVAAQTGLRVSELTALTINDLHLGTGPHIRCTGKGRKERCTPLTAPSVQALTTWLAERRGAGVDPVFCTTKGTALSRDAIARALTKHAATAAEQCTSLRTKTVTPHTLRHSAAMQLLQAGVDITVIALWLGHESTQTTRIYIHADMALKEQALARTTPLDTTPGRYTAPDTLLAFLKQL